MTVNSEYTYIHCVRCTCTKTKRTPSDQTNGKEEKSNQIDAGVSVLLVFFKKKAQDEQKEYE